ncbi:hypothetical protein L7F22_061326 [Adiantum nelumboides]|nr:hypothetical protein [Adiantum nelumboides]
MCEAYAELWRGQRLVGALVLASFRLQFKRRARGEARKTELSSVCESWVRQGGGHWAEGFDCYLRRLQRAPNFPPDALESKLLPLGDSVANTIALVCAEVLAAEQLHMDEEEFKATQAKVEATRMLAPLHNPPSDDPKLKGALHASIDLFEKGNMEEDDMEQEDILAIDEFAARKGGKRTGFGP